MSVRRLDIATGGGASITIAPYEHPLVWEFVGRGRYLQAAFCRTVTQLYSTKFGKRTAKNLTNIAAKGAFIGLLEWAKEIGCNWDESVFESGASGGSVEVLGWLVDNSCPLTNDASVCTAAASKGHVEALNFLCLHGCRANANTFLTAVAYGHLNVLQFLQRFRCDWNIPTAIEIAVESGHVHILQWMHETLHVNGLFNEYTCNAAAYGGQIEVLKWLRSVGCAWDGKTCFAAIRGGHVNVLRWAIDEGCPWTLDDKTEDLGDTALHVAAAHGRCEVLQFLIDSGGSLNALEDEGCTPIYVGAVDAQIECVKMLLTAGADVNIANASNITPLAIALMRSHHEVAEVLRAAGGRE